MSENQECMISLTQYIYPDDRTKTVQAPVSPEHKAWVEKHQPVLSAEVLPIDNHIAFYGRLREWPEEKEITLIAINAPGVSSPAKVLANLIRLLIQASESNQEEV